MVAPSVADGICRHWRNLAVRKDPRGTETVSTGSRPTNSNASLRAEVERNVSNYMAKIGANGASDNEERIGGSCRFQSNIGKALSPCIDRKRPSTTPSKTRAFNVAIAEGFLTMITDISEVDV
jgi:hypothetical protein